MGRLTDSGDPDGHPCKHGLNTPAAPNTTARLIALVRRIELSGKPHSSTVAKPVIMPVSAIVKFDRLRAIMTGNEIRKAFLEYFERHGHRVVKSSPLLPAGDPTLLFANAGMNQFKDVFLGLERRDYSRATSSQKCIRAGGKHNDLDEVGRTARHQTFFEMLGNFSFGDYFKKEAIEFAWDFLVNELKLERSRLWFTVFGGDAEVPADEEAIKCWLAVGAPPERILRFGRKDNFWQMADTGPCGPCSEVNYYLGENPEDPQFNRPDLVNGPGDTTIEFWNLVFMQFNRSGEGQTIDSGPKIGQYKSYRLDPLPAPSVDTGMGLERIALILQGVESNYDTDLLKPIIEFVAREAGKKYVYDSAEGVAMRIVADHARATAFSIADGISPGNLGRNYVLRKIMRRAIYNGVKELGLDHHFFHKVTEFVTEFMGEPYPELVTSRKAIERTVTEEEHRFSRILTVGEPKLEELFERYAPDTPPIIDLVRSYDTYGVPRDLIRVVLGRHGVETDEDEFNAQFDAALAELQRQSASGSTAVKARKESEVYSRITSRFPQVEFTGYEGTEISGARVLAMVAGGKEVESLNEGATGEVLLDRTPFYAESGGQIGDTGVLQGTGSRAAVEDTFAPTMGYNFHKVKIERGALNVGDTVEGLVDAERRRRIKANHTGTHLLHAALREVLGPHVKQAGSLVAPDRLRFDFTHYSALTDDEIAEIERLINNEILHNRRVDTQIKSLDEAMSSGAMALFGEKYGNRVRVVSVPGFSVELCGGTHVHSTGDIGPLKITSESALAAGVRRLEAITADDSVARFQADERIIRQLSDTLKAKPLELPSQVDKLQEQVRRQQREIEDLKMKLALGQPASDGQDVREVDGIRVMARRVGEMDMGTMRQLADSLSTRIRPGVVVLGQTTEGKASLAVRVTDDLIGKLNAGTIVREIAGKVGGKGGGKADMATGGGTQPENLDQALAAAADAVARMLNA
jgi:alanyl-tRNA synthetase